MYTYKYPRPALTVDALVLAKFENKMALLLIQRGIEPFLGKWALPGGFVNMDELLADACKRELEEETGLVVSEMYQFFTFDAIYRDPRHRTISVVHYVFLDSPGTLKAGDDAKNAAWFPLDELPELAFDHEQIIQKFVSERLASLPNAGLNQVQATGPGIK